MNEFILGMVCGYVEAVSKCIALFMRGVYVQRAYLPAVMEFPLYISSIFSVCLNKVRRIIKNISTLLPMSALPVLSYPTLCDNEHARSKLNIALGTNCKTIIITRQSTVRNWVKRKDLIWRNSSHMSDNNRFIEDESRYKITDS